MSIKLKSIFLLADSQPLFKTYNGQNLLEEALQGCVDGDLSAAYIGASNDNNPAYYQIFISAMQPYNLKQSRMIRQDCPQEDKDYLKRAQVILLAGGDTYKGWSWMEEHGVADILREAYLNGAILVGVSAGAVQLGLCGADISEKGSVETYDTLKLVPFCIAAHQEKNDWQDLKKALPGMGERARAFGLPFGSALIYHSKHQMQPLGPVDEFFVKNGGIYHNLLLPDNGFKE